ncbi:MAG: hydroxyacid dehydrogenase [Rhodospirillaceae bacterium]|nr:hydroxyacid dehydrogenase [Rhodospirillaceae bacterium]
MKIVIFEVEAWEREAFRDLDAPHEVVFVAEPLGLDNAEAYADAEVVSTFIYSDLSGAVLSRLGALRFIATRSTGFDHIDLGLCKGRGITVSNVPTYGDNTVAEHVFALLLTISHRMIEAVDRTRRGDFSQTGLQGFDLRDRTIGVVGTGNIGRNVIGIARGFGMRVLAYDVMPDESAATEMDFDYVALPELLARSDIVTLHVPANPATHHMIDDKAFAVMKDGAVLINTARGAVVEVRALLRALADGKIAAAGLDVLPEEPAIREEAELLRSFFAEQHDLETLLADHILLRMRNVVITPHSAFNTREAVERILKTTAENIRAFGAGASQNVVSG